MAAPIHTDCSDQALGNVSIYRCRRVDGFGPGLYNPWTPPNVLADWPTIWASVEAFVADEEIFPIEMSWHSTLADAEKDASACGATPPARACATHGERVFLYGPFTQESVHIMRYAGDDAWGLISDIQFTMAMELLLHCTVALKILTPELRRMIYGYAFSRRASAAEPSRSPLPEDSLRILIRAMPGPKRFQVTPPSSEWLMDVPTHATINDVKREIRAELWRQNAGRSPEERLERDEMEDLHLFFGRGIDFGLSPCNTDYIEGASFFKPLARTLSKDGMYVFMGSD